MKKDEQKATFANKTTTILLPFGGEGALPKSQILAFAQSVNDARLSAGGGGGYGFVNKMQSPPSSVGASSRSALHVRVCVCE